jgi:hypothetical protein
MIASASAARAASITRSGQTVFLWGAQLEQRSSATSYTATTTQPITNYIPVLLTAATNAPRFDHNPTTAESLGLLIEESRTNLFTYSADFANAAWTKTAATITANTIVAPDGALTGDKLVEDTANTAHNVNRNQGVTTGTSYALTVYAKAAERSFFRLQSFNATGDAENAVFNLTTGTVVSGTTGSTITPVGNGWYRCYVPVVNDTDTSSALSIQLFSDGTTASYTGDGYSGIYIWGAQLEAGAFPTSYIATGAATATRSADVASMTGTNFSSWVNNAEGTLYVEYINYTTATGSLFSFDDGTANNRLIAFTNVGTTPAYRVVVGGVDQAVVNLANITAGTVGKLSFGYQVNNFAGSANGAAVGTDLSGTLPTSLAVARIGVNVAGVAVLNGTIKRIAYYPQRLTNAQLQALTS